MKTVTAVRHVHFEDLGFFEEPLIAAGYEISYRDVWTDDLVTLEPLSPDLMIFLGGPMGAYEEGRYPFLSRELQIIRERVSADKPVLGICLGAQLIARALGSRVFPGGTKEIGLAPISLTSAGRRSPLAVIACDQPVVHWHADTFDLPEGATLLASTADYRNQAFSIGRNLLALQFHLEAGDGFERWTQAGSDELSAAGVDPTDLLERVEAVGCALRDAAIDVMRRWLEDVAEEATV